MGRGKSNSFFALFLHHYIISDTLITVISQDLTINEIKFEKKKKNLMLKIITSINNENIVKVFQNSGRINFLAEGMHESILRWCLCMCVHVRAHTHTFQKKVKFHSYLLQVIFP